MFREKTEAFEYMLESIISKLPLGVSKNNNHSCHALLYITRMKQWSDLQELGKRKIPGCPLKVKLTIFKL